MSTDDSTSIDVGSWFSTLARGWWVIIGLVVVGIVVGAVVTLVQPKEYTATASVYIGQTTDASGNPMAGLNSNAKAAVQLLASQVVLEEAAERTGMDVSASTLRRQTTVETPSSTVKTTTSVVNIIVISVTDTDAERAAAAANALAEVLLARLESGVDEKVAVLERQLADSQEAYAASLARSVEAQKALSDIAKGGGSAADKAAAGSTWVALAQAAATQQESLSRSIQQTELLLLSAQQNEQPRMLH
jgi:capsular polysaccharide biosynthesis protein